ncbi:MAG: DUF853 family protein [Bacilli bacterium]|nr:DUF853 family protein [Bacilli bacterium]
MYLNEKILIGKSKDKELSILPNMANRHGIITGASGTGKTVTSKVMAESFSDAGIPVFMADVKGDLSGTCLEGKTSEKIEERIKELKLKDFEFKSFPVRFWDIYGEGGHPIRTTISRVGPDVLSIMLGLSEVQEGVLDIVFKIAEDEELQIDDLKDLRMILKHVGDNRSDYTTKYGNITPQSIGVIQRSLLALEKEGADYFFGKPDLDINDFMKTESGKGYINILDATKLFQNPDLYAAFLLWLLVELFQNMEEVGDLDKPKIVFFFDEAHLLFENMPEYRLKKINQVVRLIRSRGIGLYFVTHNPTDVPDNILSQLGNRVQHNLRAYTPAEQKVVKAAAQAFRVNEKFDTEKAILELGTGEALVSFQNEKGEPEVVEKVTILPPQSDMGTIDNLTKNKIINNSELAGKYDEREESESAYEILKTKIDEREAAKKAEEERKVKEKEEKELAKKKREEEKEAARLARQKQKEEENSPMGQAKKMGKRVIQNTTSGFIRRIANAIVKSVMGKKK